LPVTRRGRKKGDTRYPWPLLEVGDSFDVPLDVNEEGLDGPKLVKTISGAGCGYARYDGGGLKYTVRLIREEGVVRVWRVR